MGIATADFRNETAERIVPELEHVCRRDIVCHDDHIDPFVVGIRGNRMIVGRRTGQHFHDPFGHLLDIGLAFSQIGVLDMLETCGQFLDLRHQRPFGVVTARPDDVERFFRYDRIGQNHGMHIEKSAQFDRRILRQACPDRFQLFLYGSQCLLQTFHFGFHLFLRNQIVFGIHRRMGDQMGAAYRNTARDGNAEQ